MQGAHIEKRLIFWAKIDPFKPPNYLQLPCFPTKLHLVYSSIHALLIGSTFREVGRKFREKLADVHF